MTRKYKLGDEITATNGKRECGTGKIFKGIIIGFQRIGYVIAYEHGWTLTPERQKHPDWEIDAKYIGTTMWHVTSYEIEEPQIPSNALISKIANTNPSDTGNHAECYPHPKNRKKILLATNCPARRLMAKRKFPDSSYFPKPRAVGKLGKTEVYEMDKFEHITYENEKKMSNLDRKIYRIIENSSLPSILRCKNIPKPIKTALKIAEANIKRAGYEPALDACDHNMMMTATGQLVFTDLFWIYKSEYE